ncbi:MAG: hypothetical protein ACJAT7_002754 [Psychromonas sp.]|jgi:hypothetical protein|uniref:hypothetical protein n=1 Tax=Psychromonas sp. TaxID=1884585 RepID=UPI0039E5BAF2
MNAVAVRSTTKSIDESRAEIYALFNANSQGGLIWEKLEQAERRVFCFAAELKKSHVDKPLSQFDELERHKLLRAIKSIEQTAKQFTTVSLQDFK